MVTSVPSPTLGPNGFVAPSEADVLTGVQADMNAAFGGNMNPALETQQGQVATAWASNIGAKNDEFLALANGVDPAFADGRMQDAIGRIYFLTRDPAISTTVTGTCSGLPGVVIPSGSPVPANDGNLYVSTTPGTIGAGGTVDITFACQVTGPIVCAAGSLGPKPYRAIPGWDSVTNAADGTVGRAVETRAEFEQRRKDSVAANAVNALEAIRGRVLAVPNVLDAYVIDNSTSGSVTVGGVTLAAYNTYVAAVGGVPQDVATAIWRKKPPGGPYYTGAGSAAYTVLDANSGYALPYPSYMVHYLIPASLPIIFAVSITNSSAVPSNATGLIQAAIVKAFAGGDGGARARIGGEVYASRFFAPVAALGPWAANIVSLKIGSTNVPGAVVTASVAGVVMTVTAIGSGALAIGQTLFGANVLPATTIINQLSGSAGSTGTYTVSASQTAASATVTAVAPLLDTVQAQINQFPTVSAAEIAVTFV